MNSSINFRTPKLNRSIKQRNTFWYNYYAGYSSEFVEDAIKFLKLPSKATIADPWNGTGTSTEVAANMGFNAKGFDINPVMVIIGKAKLANHIDSSYLLTLSNKILENASYCSDSIIENNQEPLENWFDSNAALVFRKLEYSIRTLFIPQSPSIYTLINEKSSLVDIPSIACFFYTALFRTLWDFLIPFRSSNRTWVKTSKLVEERLAISQDKIYYSFEKNVNYLTELLQLRNNLENISKEKNIDIDISNSERLPLQNESIQAVISSPPYCTRIDYAIATKPELALLGYKTDKKFFRLLRDSMIGTPTITKAIVSSSQPSWGETCKKFLDSVAAHKSRASRSYYLKYYLQYFNSIYNSIKEIDRILIKEGHCVLVVQDSYYKDVHNNLPQMFKDMGISLGWRLKNSQDFLISCTMADINSRARKYQTLRKTTETILAFQKI